MLSSSDKRTIRENISEDRMIFRKNGSVEFRRHYFYRHGWNEEMFADGVQKGLAVLGFHAERVSTEDKWQQWPRDSWFAAIFKVTTMREAADAARARYFATAPTGNSEQDAQAATARLAAFARG